MIENFKEWRFNTNLNDLYGSIGIVLHGRRIDFAFNRFLQRWLEDSRQYLYPINIKGMSILTLYRIEYHACKTDPQQSTGQKA